MPNERGRIHEHKALVSPCGRCVQKPHMVTVSSAQLTAFAVLLLALAVIKQRCITAGAPFWIGFFIRPHAPNRGPYATVLYEYMYRATPNIYTHSLYTKLSWDFIRLRVYYNWHFFCVCATFMVLLDKIWFVFLIWQNSPLEKSL